MKKIAFHFFAACTMCIFILFSTSHAQSLLSNGTFDSSLSSWESFNRAIWIANDGADSSGNGSLELKDDFNNGSSIYAESELVPVVEGYHYILANSYKYQDATIPNAMSIAINWYNSQGDYLGQYPWNVRFDLSQADQWLEFDTVVENIIQDATQARVLLYIHKHSSGTAFNTGRFDDVILFQDTVFMSDFD